MATSLRPVCAINHTKLQMPVKVVHEHPNEACEKNVYQIQALVELMTLAVFEGKKSAQCPMCRQEFTKISLVEDRAKSYFEEKEEQYHFKLKDEKLAVAEQIAQKAKANDYSLTMEEAKEIRDLMLSSGQVSIGQQEDTRCDLKKLIDNFCSANAGNWIFVLGIVAGGVLTLNQIWKGVFKSSLLPAQKKEIDKQMTTHSTPVNLMGLGSRINRPSYSSNVPKV